MAKPSGRTPMVAYISQIFDRRVHLSLSALSIHAMEDINPRRLVRVHPERVTDVSSTDFPGHYPGEDHSWDHELFEKVSPNVLRHTGTNALRPEA